MAKAFTAVGRMLEAPPGASTASMSRAVADIFIIEVGGTTGRLFGLPSAPQQMRYLPPGLSIPPLSLACSRLPKRQ